jgi:hypothetical protein
MEKRKTTQEVIIMLKRKQKLEPTFQNLEIVHNVSKSIDTLTTFNINTIPLDLGFKEGLIFTEKIIVGKEGKTKISYVIFPQSSLRETKNKRQALNTRNVRDLSFLVKALMNRESDPSPFGKKGIGIELDMERIITFDGWEIYKSNELDLELMETQSKPSDFNDRKTDWEFSSYYWNWYNRNNSFQTKELMSYKISHQLVSILQKTGMNIAELSYPSSTNQHTILRSDYSSKFVDPPTIKIVFPKTK